MLTHHTIEEADEDRMTTEEQTTTAPKNEEEAAEVKKKPVYRALLDYWQIAIKILELILCVTCTALIVDPIQSAHSSHEYIHHFIVVFTTFNGYVIIITVTLLGRLLGDRLSFKTSALFSLIASGLFLASGCLILSDHTNFERKYIFYPNRYLLNMMCASGVFAIINSVVFVADAVLTFRLQNNL